MEEGKVVLNDRYRLLERVGSGGMSVVFKAQDLSLGRIVALKMLHYSLTDDEGFLRRFQREAHAAANLTHSNIVTVHDIGQDGHRHYIVMEYVDGRTLKQIVRQQNKLERPLPINRALDLMIQVCNGIGYAHRAHLVHCDVKPQNILVTRDDRVKVADFGIARAISEASQQLEKQVWGTPQYFSPEQASGQPATPASDVYAIGVILFELLTGRLPFQAETHAALALKHLQEPPPRVTDFNPQVPGQLEHIVAKVLAKEPAARYRTAGQLGRILSTYRQSSQEETGPIYPVVGTGPLPPVAEQKTQIHQYIPPRLGEDGFLDETALGGMDQATPRRGRTATTAPGDSAGLAISSAPGAVGETLAPTEVESSLATPPAGVDWLALGLGVTALIALLGLIPLWFLVYRAWAG